MCKLVDLLFLINKHEIIYLDLFFSLRCPYCHSVWSRSTPSWITSKEGESDTYVVAVYMNTQHIFSYYLRDRLLMAVIHSDSI